MTASGTRRGGRAPALDYSVLSVPLGLAGSGSAWTAAARLFALPTVIGELLFAVGVLIWLAVVVARVPVTPARWRALRAAFRDPVTGPFPAYVPIVGLLLTTHYAPHLPHGVAQLLSVVGVVTLALMCGTLIAFWLGGTVRLHHLHPGYSLPVIAGPYIASSCLTTVGFRDAGLAAMGAGTFFWLAIGTIILGRLIIAQPMSPTMAPTLAVIVTPPVTGGLAWFALAGGRIDEIQHLLLGVILLMLAAVLFLVPTLVKAPFTMVWWSFSFPAGALAGYAMRWDAALHTSFTTVLALVALSGASLLLVLLTAMSVRTALTAGPGSERTPGPTGAHRGAPEVPPPPGTAQES